MQQYLDMNGLKTVIDLVNNSMQDKIDSIQTILDDTIIALFKPPEIVTESIPDMTAGSNVDIQLEAVGVETISWEIVDGRLPDNLILNNDGRITGTIVEEGEHVFTVRALGVNKLSSDYEFVVNIEPLQWNDVWKVSGK